jgi:hypothetical protein
LDQALANCRTPAAPLPVCHCPIRSRSATATAPLAWPAR